MSEYFPGDEVCCKITDSCIVYNYIKIYDFIEVFDIVCEVVGGYLVKVPIRCVLSNSFTADKYYIREYSIPIKFIGVNMHFITDNHIVSLRSRFYGEHCDRCQEFISMAARDTDGKFKCYACRTNRYR